MFMLVAITILLSTRVSRKVVQILKFKSWAALRLTAAISLEGHIRLDQSPVSPTQDTDLAPFYTRVAGISPKQCHYYTLISL